MKPKESPVTSSSEIVEESKEMKENNGNSGQNVHEDLVRHLFNHH